MSFVNFHRHSQGSLLDGAGTPRQGAEYASKLKQTALSISDHGNLIMVPDHISACNDIGIKPIVGMEAYFKPDRHKKDNDNRKAYHLLLICQNEQGWKNLIKLSTEAHLSGFYYKPCVDWELLEEYNEGLICSSACVGGYVPDLILTAQDYAITAAVEHHLEIFGEDRYFLEIMPHDLGLQQTVNNKLANLHQQYDIPMLATCDSHYPYKDWKDTQDVILMMATGQSLAKRKKKKEAGEDVYEMDMPLHMFSGEEMYSLFAENHPDLPFHIVDQAIKNTETLAERIKPFDIDRTSNKAPVAFDNPDDAFEELEGWCFEGLVRIDHRLDEQYLERMKHELHTIREMGVVDYFVIVGRLVRWAREQGIRISSGRGSAAGSLVCYLVRITTIDPIAHDLLFERFLNPNRKGLPDIDLDFEHERRDEVKAEAARQIGEGRVCDIAAFTTFGPKSAIKDVGRVFDVPLDHLNYITQQIPEPKDVGGAGNVPPLEKLRQDSSVIEEFSKEYSDIWKHSLRVEGHVKALSTHAAGIVMTQEPITNYMPMMNGPSGIITGWSDSAFSPIISECGFLKLDVLSLDGLSKQGNAIRIIEEKYGEKIDLDDLPVASDPQAVDPEVMEIFRRGTTLGVFQFGGSRGIIAFLKHTRPDRFEDLIAVNALYRPGPLDGGDAFLYGDIKQGKAPVNYWHESIIPFLEKTYGLMVYQEQMQQIAQSLGEFSPSDSDDMRKATSKIYRMGKAEGRQFISKYKEQWMKGCKHNGLSEEESEDIWEKMLAFGGYSFNRSHSASYALFAYQDAYLKSHYPDAFYAPLLDSGDNLDMVVREARNMDIRVNPPDINWSDKEFRLVDKELLYGLLRVKFVGDVTVKEILDKRPFTSLEDFRRVERRKCNSQAYEFLHMGGAFDAIGGRLDWSVDKKREGEIEALGVALTGTGESEKYSGIIDERITSEIEFENLKEGSGITVGGEIVSIKEHIIKTGKNKGQPMAFVDIAFRDNDWDCVLFSHEYDKYRPILSSGNLIMARGRKSDRGSLIVQQMTTLEELKEVLESENV